MTDQQRSAFRFRVPRLRPSVPPPRTTAATSSTVRPSPQPSTTQTQPSRPPRGTSPAPPVVPSPTPPPPPPVVLSPTPPPPPQEPPTSPPRPQEPPASPPTPPVSAPPPEILASPTPLSRSQGTLPAPLSKPSPSVESLKTVMTPPPTQPLVEPSPPQPKHEPLPTPKDEPTPSPSPPPKDEPASMAPKPSKSSTSKTSQSSSSSSTDESESYTEEENHDEPITTPQTKQIISHEIPNLPQPPNPTATNPTHFSNEKPPIITLAGDNRGTSMHIGGPTREKSIHINRRYKLNNDQETDEDDDEEKENDSKANENEQRSSYVNCNIQGINNSLVFNCSITEKSPGVHFGSCNLKKLKRKCIKSTDLNNHPQKHTVRRRCLRGLFMESSDSDPNHPQKPRRHGCRYTSNKDDKRDVAN